MKTLHCDVCDRPTLMADAVFLQDGIDLCETCWDEVQAVIAKMRSEKQPPEATAGEA